MNLKSAYINILSLFVDFVEKIYWIKLKQIYKKIKYDFNLSESTVIADVGSHKGETIEFFQKVFQTPIFYCFEPSKSTFQILESKYGKEERIKLNNIAMSEKLGEQIFYESPLSTMSSLIKHNNGTFKNVLRNLILMNKNQKSYSVPTHTLDSYFGEIEKCGILKIDTEGTEYEILLGGLKCLAAYKFSVIQIEIHRDRERGHAEHKINKLLDTYGYSLVYILRHPSGLDVYDLIYLNSKEIF